jgi:hypothetical protein
MMVLSLQVDQMFPITITLTFFSPTAVCVSYVRLNTLLPTQQNWQLLEPPPSTFGRLCPDHRYPGELLV